MRKSNITEAIEEAITAWIKREKEGIFMIGKLGFVYRTKTHENREEKHL